jgi:hypothetical protein
MAARGDPLPHSLALQTTQLKPASKVPEGTYKIGKAIKTVTHRLLFIIVLLIGGQTEAHNRAFAVAEPASPFIIDGDLSDWNGHVGAQHSLRTSKSQDSNGVFWVAYAPAGDTLYIAAEIHDDDIVLQPQNPAFRSAHRDAAQAARRVAGNTLRYETRNADCEPHVANNRLPTEMHGSAHTRQTPIILGAKSCP